MKIIMYIKNKLKRLFISLTIRMSPMIRSDKLYLRILFRLFLGEKLHLNRPKTFAEKCQWLKIYDRNPLYTTMVDKLSAKEYIKNKIGAEYVIPTYHVWNSVDEIDINLLPDKFVIKTTNSGGGDGVYICKDKSNVNMDTLKATLEKGLKMNLYKLFREWQYKDISPKIIAEKLLEDSSSPYLRDFKFYCFNGEPKIMYITSNKGLGETKEDFFDMEGNKIDVEDVNYSNNPDHVPGLPNQFNQMKFLAKKLSKDIPLIRVDFYEIENKIYFGELTFFECAGFVKFRPDEINVIWGDWIHLPSKR